MFLVVILVFLGISSAFAQQDAAVAIAEQIVPVTENLTDNFVGCVERLVKIGTPNKDARRDCLKATDKVIKVVSDVSDDASGAANASRPMIVSGSRYGRSYGSSSSIVVVPNTSSSRTSTPRVPKLHTPTYHETTYSSK